MSSFGVGGTNGHAIFWGEKARTLAAVRPWIPAVGSCVEAQPDVDFRKVFLKIRPERSCWNKNGRMVDTHPQTGSCGGKAQNWWFAHHVCSGCYLPMTNVFRLKGWQQIQNLCASSEEDHASHSTNRHGWHNRSLALGLQRVAHLQFSAGVVEGLSKSRHFTSLHMFLYVFVFNVFARLKGTYIITPHTHTQNTSCSYLFMMITFWYHLINCICTLCTLFCICIWLCICLQNGIWYNDIWISNQIAISARAFQSYSPPKVAGWGWTTKPQWATATKSCWKRPERYYIYIIL